MEYFILIFVAVASFFAGRFTMTRFTPKQVEQLDEIRGEAKKALSTRTEKRKQQIVDFIKEKVEQQTDLAECSGIDAVHGVMRIDIEELLDVSSNTARKYLNALEAEEKIVQVGGSGRDVYYILQQ